MRHARFRWDGRYLWHDDGDGFAPIETHDPARYLVGLFYGENVAESIVDDVRSMFHCEPPIEFSAPDVARRITEGIAP